MKYLVISIALLILSFLNFLAPLRNVSVFLLSPLNKGFYSLGVEVSKYINFMTNISNIYSENQKLKEDLLSLNVKVTQLEDLLDESDSAKEHFSDPLVSSLDADYNQIMANILGNSTDLTKSTMYIDKGYGDGVKVGDSVIYKNNLLGKVLSVESRRSLISLLYSPQMNISARNISSRDSSEGIVTGEFGLGLRLDRVLQREELSVGDIYVTSGKDGIFPPNLIIGRVSKVYDIPTEPLKKAEIAPLIEINEIYKVFVLVSRD